MSRIGDPCVEAETYDVEGVCKAIGVGRTTLWKLEKLGLIHPVKCLARKRFHKEEVTRFLRSQTQASARASRVGSGRRPKYS